MRKNFGAALTLIMFIAHHGSALASNLDEDFLPFGKFPRIKSQPSGTPGTLSSEVKNLGSTLKRTVKTFASYRDTTCFGDPCLFQAFPIMYSKPDSGFFGGVRAKLTNISRNTPYLYSLDAGLIRSDTQQWKTFINTDFPEIRFLPFRPRLKTRSFYFRTTETRWYGSGNHFDVTITDADENYRYSSSEIGVGTSLIIPLVKIANQKISAFGTFNRISHRPSAFGAEKNSKLLSDSPRGSEGGASSGLGFGLQLDSRDRELLTKTGWSLEMAAEYSNLKFSQFNFKRFTIIDRRYFSKSRFTFANRVTMDGLVGAEPFWELSGVGGIDPILDVSYSQLLKGFPIGRFHERFKIINNSEIRIELNPVRIFGLLTQFTLTPIAIDLGRLSEQSAVSVATGSRIVFNRNFQVMLLFAASRDQNSLQLTFGQDY